MARIYKWQPHGGGRHAIPTALAVNEVGHTLCGVAVTAGSDSWPDEARFWPTCDVCDLVWRKHEGLLPWPRKGKDAEPVSSWRPRASNASNGDTSTALSVSELLAARR